MLGQRSRFAVALIGRLGSVRTRRGSALGFEHRYGTVHWRRICSDSRKSTADQVFGYDETAKGGSAAGTNGADTGSQGPATAKPTPGASGDQNTQQSTGTPDAQERVQRLEGLLQEKEQEIATLRDRAIRLLAEMENVRMIARRDVEAARKYSISSFAKELLDVADNLNRALAAVPRQQLEVSSSSNSTGAGGAVSAAESAKLASLLTALYEGVSATERELQRTLQKFGIERYGEIGEPFNPEVHQAVFEAPAPVADSATSEQSGAAKPSPSLPDGAILHVLKAGYRIHDRVLRPAEVGVVKNVSPST